MKARWSRSWRGGKRSVRRDRGIGPSGAAVVRLRCSPTAIRPPRAAGAGASAGQCGRARHRARRRDPARPGEVEDAAAHAVREADNRRAQSTTRLTSPPSSRPRPQRTLTPLRPQTNRVYMRRPAARTPVWPPPRSASSSRSTTRAPISARSARGSTPVLDRVAGSWEIVFVDDGSERRHPRAHPGRERPRRPDRRGLVLAQLRQGDRHRGRARPRARTRRRDHGCRPSASAGDDRDLRGALARGLRDGLRPAHRPVGRDPHPARLGASVLPPLRALRRDRPAGGRRRLPAHRPHAASRCCGRSASARASRRGSMPGSASRRRACPSWSGSGSTAPPSGASAGCSASRSTASRRSRRRPCASGPISAGSCRSPRSSPRSCSRCTPSCTAPTCPASRASSCR